MELASRHNVSPVSSGESKVFSVPNDLFHHAVSSLASKTSDPLSANGVSFQQP